MDSYWKSRGLTKANIFMLEKGNGVRNITGFILEKQGVE
jgi:hypothetical protein